MRICGMGEILYVVERKRNLKNLLGDFLLREELILLNDMFSLMEFN